MFRRLGVAGIMAAKFAQLNSRTILRTDVRSCSFAIRSSKTFLKYQKFTSGREDLNLRPRGPKPRALPS